MVFGEKGKLVYTPMNIYRGNDPEYMEFPIKKTECAFEKMGSFEARLKWAAKYGTLFSLGYSYIDVVQICKLTERRAQLARVAFFTIPGVTAVVGWMAALEISKKMLGRENYKEAYFAAATVPAAVAAVWRSRLSLFPKVAIPLGILGAAYQHSIDHNYYFGMGSVYENPNEPMDHNHRSMSIFGEARTIEFARMKWLRGTFFRPTDPGPTYSKWE